MRQVRKAQLGRPQYAAGFENLHCCWLGTRNQHPGYGSAYVGDEQIAAALRAIYEGPCADDTLTIVTYDEFGGAWDHVPPPGQGPTTKGPMTSSARGPAFRRSLCPTACPAAGSIPPPTTWPR